MIPVCKNCGKQIRRSHNQFGNGWTHVVGIEFNGRVPCDNGTVAEPIGGDATPQPGPNLTAIEAICEVMGWQAPEDMTPFNPDPRTPMVGDGFIAQETINELRAIGWAVVPCLPEPAETQRFPFSKLAETPETPEPPRMNGETAIASGNASGLTKDDDDA